MSEKPKINPYEPPRIPVAEPPVIKPPKQQVVSKEGIKLTVPLLNYVVHKENPEIRYSGIYNHQGEQPYFFEVPSNTDDQKALHFLGKMCTFESDTSGSDLNAPRTHQIISCDLSNPLLKPTSLSGEDTVNVAFSSGIMIENAEKIQEVLRKYYPDNKDPYGVIAKMDHMMKHLHACDHPDEALNANSPIFQSEYLHNLLMDGPTPLLEYNINAGYGRTGVINSEDLNTLQSCASKIINQYAAEKEHFDNAMHHVLYKQAELGLEVEPEKKQSVFSKCATTMGAKLQKYWPKKLNPPEQEHGR